MNIRPATKADIHTLIAVINSAYEVERFFKNRDRLTLNETEVYYEKGTFLIAEDESGLAGTVYVKLNGDQALFGLLSVDPSKQSKGLGRRLINAAEDFARARNCRCMNLEVVNLRTELPPFYRKLGYKETGTAPFPKEALSTQPCHFVLMSKPLL